MMNNQDILDTLNKDVYGHEQAKKALITLVNRAKSRHYIKWGLFRKTSLLPMRCLLIGDSGTGKTFLVETLSKLMEFPYLYIDATHLNPTGATGGINASKLIEMIKSKANQYLSQPGYYSIDGVLDQMVIFVDEFDKLANSFESSGNWNTHTQANFLTIIDNKQELSGLSWVFAGAFHRLRQANKFITKNIGFTQESRSGVSPITDSMLIKEGLIPEIVGRLSAIISLDEFTEIDYSYILDTYILPKKLEALKELHLHEVTLDSRVREQIIKNALQSDQGIRSLERQLNEHFLELEFNHVRPS